MKLRTEFNDIKKDIQKKEEENETIMKISLFFMFIGIVLWLAFWSFIIWAIYRLVIHFT